MASNRKIWKTKRFFQLVFISSLILLIIFFIYDKKIPVQYVLHDKIPASFEYRIKTEKADSNGDSLEYVKILMPGEIEGNVNFKGDASEVKKTPFSGGRIVHIDLKGAPPRVSYFAEFFPFIKKLGATGLLLEYEDMFPYLSVDAAAGNAYTKEDIQTILNYAQESSLEVIPLIQTFGHLEFLLKLSKYKHLRENPKYPQAICPSKNDSLTILFSLIDEILASHPSLKYLHIGCDEVYQLAECPDCRLQLHNRHWTKQDLFLYHVTTLARYISSKSSVKVLIWDDELRTLPSELLNSWELGSLLEPVVWKYTPDLEEYLPPELWLKYSQIFKGVWFASAFKGARYPDSFTTDTNYYFENQKAWLSLVEKYSPKVEFRGGFLTGWQRYDHFAVLCELLPVSVPSLTLSLLYLSTDIKSVAELSERSSRHLGCDSMNLRGVLLGLGAAGGPGDSHTCSFPGSCALTLISRLPSLIAAASREKQTSPYLGWMSPYNIKFSFSNPSHVEEATNNLLNIYSELNEIEHSLRQCMDLIYDNSTTEEWFFTYIKPLRDDLQIAIEARDRILTKDDWPKRPLTIS